MVVDNPVKTLNFKMPKNEPTLEVSDTTAAQ